MYNKMAKTLVEFETLWYQVGLFTGALDEDVKTKTKLQQ